VKITDFGLARTADDASISQSGIIAGTPMYMAPEQAKGETLDQRADLFSLGSVLYHMVAGRPPFRANSAVAVLKRVAEDQPRAIREIIPETPQWLCDIIAKLHAKDPADRYQSALEVADVLADCEEQLKANARLKDFSRIPKPTATPRAAGRGRWVAAAAVRLLPVIALGVTEFAGLTHLFRFERDPMKPGQEHRNSPEVPRTAADVLPFLAGNWKMERQTGDPEAPSEKAEFVGHLTYDFVAGGKFLRGRGDMGEGRADLLFLFDFDPGTKGLHWRQAWSSGLTAEYISGQFLADTRTLMFSHRIGALDSVSQFYFVDANTFIHRYFFKDQSGTITRESKATFARIPGPAALRTLPTDPARPDKMKVLDRLVGEWRNEITVSVAGPDTKVETLRVKAEPILGGRFIEKFETNEATGVSDYTLSWFDTDAKKYRTWFFNHAGSVTEFTGTWDEAAKTLTWNSADGRLEGRWTFKSDDLREYRHIVKDKDGKVLNEAAGVSRRTASAAVAPFTDADVQRVAALPAEEQVEEVRKELVRRNPGFDGKIEHKIEGSVVTELRIVTDRVTDIVPIRVFNDLRILDCSGTRTDKPYGLLADLTPLRGMRLAALTYLNLCNTKVGDAGLAHIEDCKALTGLNLGGTKVSDAGLAKFKDCKNLTTLHLYWTNVSDAGLVHFQDCKDLTDLSLAGTKVSDVGLAHFKDCKNLTHLHVDHTRLGNKGLTHFKGLRLTSLWIYNTGVTDTDLTPLQGMPLEDILLTPKSITRGLDILRDMKSLKIIGIDFGQSWPAAEFWERYDTGEFKE
jgi:hypothetical protein